MTNYFNRLTSWYFNRKSLPYWGIFAVDCLIVIVSSLFVYILNYGLFETISVFGKLIVTLLIYLFCFTVGFRIFHTYSGIIRYSSFIDLLRLSQAVLIGAALSLCARELMDHYPTMFIHVRLRDIIYWSLLSILLMWALRVIVKFIYDGIYNQSDTRDAFIFGVLEGGIAIAKSMRNQHPRKYRLCGFVADDPQMYGRVMLGVNVYRFDSNLVDVMKKKGVEILFISPLKSDVLRENQKVVDSLIEGGIKIYVVPEEQEWDGKSDIRAQQMRQVVIEDFLPRKSIEVDMDKIGEQLNGKRILITGAAGSIGSEIVRQVSACNPAELILIDQAETPLHDIRLMMKREYPAIKAYTIVADIANKKRMADIFRQHTPHYVFHAAAYKHVPMMEDNPAESIQNNVEGTRIVADLAVKYGTKKFVMVSTDKAVNPTNVMGCSKRICEIYVQSLDKAIKEGRVEGHTQFVTTRFGNVLGSNGSVIPLFKKQILEGGPVTVTHPDIIRYFMLIPEACKLVLEAGTMGHGGEIFVFDMGEPVKIVDLANRMIQLSGADIEIKFTGLRDGEKLYEEVLNEKETTLPTIHPKIMVAKVREYDYEMVSQAIDRLLDSTLTDDNMSIVKRMKELVPEFRSQNSVYQALD